MQVFFGQITEEVRALRTFLYTTASFMCNNFFKIIFTQYIKKGDFVKLRHCSLLTVHAMGQKYYLRFLFCLIYDFFHVTRFVMD